LFEDYFNQTRLSVLGDSELRFETVADSDQLICAGYNPMLFCKGRERKQKLLDALDADICLGRLVLCCLCLCSTPI
jgi:hypothetical protein